MSFILICIWSWHEPHLLVLQMSAVLHAWSVPAWKLSFTKRQKSGDVNMSWTSCTMHSYDSNRRCLVQYLMERDCGTQLPRPHYSSQMLLEEVKCPLPGHLLVLRLSLWNPSSCMTYQNVSGPCRSYCHNKQGMNALTEESAEHTGVPPKVGS